MISDYFGIFVLRNEWLYFYADNCSIQYNQYTYGVKTLMVIVKLVCHVYFGCCKFILNWSYYSVFLMNIIKILIVLCCIVLCCIIVYGDGSYANAHTDTHTSKSYSVKL